MKKSLIYFHSSWAFLLLSTTLYLFSHGVWGEISASICVFLSLLFFCLALHFPKEKDLH